MLYEKAEPVAAKNKSFQMLRRHAAFFVEKRVMKSGFRERSVTLAT
jgi:hypothetical protein